MKAILTAALGYLVLTSCDSAPVKKPSDTPTDSLSASNYDPETEMQIIDPRPDVSSINLDGNDFRLNGFRVALQDYMRSESPALTYFSPESSDYVEIMRCRADTDIRIDDISLKEVAFGTSDPDEESRIYQKYNFWKTAEELDGCILIADGYGDSEIFIDGFALSGSYHYLARACVNQDRLQDKEISNRNCSRQVAFSRELSDFVNQRAETQRKYLSEAMEARNEADSLGRLVYYTIIDYNNAIVDCEKREGKRLATVQDKQAIGNAVGVGVSLAATIYAGGASAGSAASGASGASGASESFNYVKGFKYAWENKDQAVGTGMQLGAAINNLFSSQADIPRSCTLATKAKQDGVVYTKQLKASHELYAIKMDAAREAEAHVEELENQ